jgi:hypothetical protein
VADDLYKRMLEQHDRSDRGLSAVPDREITRANVREVSDGLEEARGNQKSWRACSIWKRATTSGS